MKRNTQLLLLSWHSIFISHSTPKVRWSNGGSLYSHCLPPHILHGILKIHFMLQNVSFASISHSNTRFQHNRFPKNIEGLLQGSLMITLNSFFTDKLISSVQNT